MAFASLSFSSPWIRTDVTVLTPRPLGEVVTAAMIILAAARMASGSACVEDKNRTLSFLLQDWGVQITARILVGISR